MTKIQNILKIFERQSRDTMKANVAKVLFKDLNPGIAMAIVRFKFSRKLHFCFESVIRQKFNFFAFSEMAQNF